MEKYLREYRAQLVAGRQQVIDNYEKTLLTLTTGATAEPPQPPPPPPPKPK